MRDHPGEKLGAPADPELAIDVLEVGPDRREGDPVSCGNLLI